MIKSLNDTVKLNNGVMMPQFGLGVWENKDHNECVNAIIDAIQAGYKSIDTAMIYGNETSVGEAIANCGVPREELFITSKVWNSNQGYDAALRAYDESLERLQLDYLDLYLIHWPVPMAGEYLNTWLALEKIYQEKRVSSIGVSNFTVAHLENVIANSSTVPVVNQIEYHPWLIQTELNEYMKEKNIYLEAYSPLAHGELIGNSSLQKIADCYGKSVAQVLLRWDLQCNVITIPKSVRKERIVENANIYDFALTDDDMKVINAMNKNYRTAPDPDLCDIGAVKNK